MGIDTTTSEWAKAKEELDDNFAKGLFLDEFGSPYTKKEALNEWQLRQAQMDSEIYGIVNPYLDSSVKYRHDGMDLQGNATNVWRSSLSQGWQSMSEAASGAQSLIGSLIGNQSWYESGMLSAEAKANQMQRLPKFVQNIR